MGKSLIWPVAAATLASYLVLVGWLGPQVDAGGLRPFDLRPSGYDLDGARAFLAALTPEGRAIYLGPVRIADTVFPLLMTLTFVLVSRGLGWIAVLPALAYGGLDLAENAQVAALLRSGVLDPAAVALASLLTMTKFGAFALACLVALAALVRRRRAGG